MCEKSYCYKYPHAAVTADCVVFGFDGERLHILLVRRAGNPFKGMWALPGGFLNVETDPSIEACAQRELAEETNARDIYMRQFHVFSEIDRDPRERVLTVAFLALVRKDDREIRGGSDADDAKWFDLSDLPELAFDHLDIINAARVRLKEILRVEPIAFRLLNRKFLMRDLQRLYEQINETRYDRGNFAKKIKASEMIIDLGPSDISVHNRVPHFYEFDETKYSQYLKDTDKRKFLFDF